MGKIKTTGIAVITINLLWNTHQNEDGDIYLTQHNMYIIKIFLIWNDEKQV